MVTAEFRRMVMQRGYWRMEFRVVDTSPVEWNSTGEPIESAMFINTGSTDDLPPPLTAEQTAVYEAQIVEQYIEALAFESEEQM